MSYLESKQVNTGRLRGPLVLEWGHLACVHSLPFWASSDCSARRPCSPAARAGASVCSRAQGQKPDEPSPLSPLRPKHPKEISSVASGGRGKPSSCRPLVTHYASSKGRETETLKMKTKGAPGGGLRMSGGPRRSVCAVPPRMPNRSPSSPR